MSGLLILGPLSESSWAQPPVCPEPDQDTVPTANCVALAEAELQSQAVTQPEQFWPDLVQSPSYHWEPKRRKPRSRSPRKTRSSQPRQGDPFKDLNASDRRFEHRFTLDQSRFQIRGETSQSNQLGTETEDKLKSRYEISLQRPLMRSPQQEFSLSIGFAYLDETSLSPPPGGGPAGPGGPMSAAASRPAMPSPTAAPGLTAAPSRTMAPAPPPRLSEGREGRAMMPPPPSRPSPVAVAPTSSLDATAQAAPSRPAPPAPLDTQRSAIFQLGQNFTHRDESGEWRLASRFDFGTGLLDATATQNASADGQFFGWQGRIERSQILSRNHQFRLRFQTQLANDSLLKPQQFKIGKAPKVRGLKSKDFSGDNGLLLTLEEQMTLLRDRRTQASQLQFSPLLEMGYVWNQAEAPPGRASSHFLTLVGAGLTLNPTPWSRVNLNVRMPLWYENDLGDRQAEETFLTTLTYQARW